MLLGFLAPLGLVMWSGKPLEESCLIVASVFLGNLGWTMMNEFKDAKVDAVNKPWKPIPSRQVDKYNVLFLSCSFITFSLILSYNLMVYYGLIYGFGLLAHLGCFIYNCVKKDIVGNAYMAFAYGAAALISVYPHYLTFSLAFALLTLAFNLAVQYQDLGAEKAAGVTTAPQQLGKAGTSLLGGVLSGLSFWMFWDLFKTTGYLPLVSFIAAGVLSEISSVSINFVGAGSKVQEILNRYLGRIFLLIGFIWMIVTEVMK